MAATSIVLRMCRHWSILGVPLISGCSVAFMQAPPDDHAKLRYFDCVSSTAAPVTDTVNAALNGLVVAFASGESGEGGAAPPTTVVFGGVAALYAASAIYGYIAAANCDSAKQNLAVRIHRREAEDAQRIDALEQQLELSHAGCSSDADCKGARVCVSGACNTPTPSAEPSPPTPVAPEVVPESAPVP